MHANVCWSCSVLKVGCKISWQNMKMKISSPRFLNVGSWEILNTEFPACLEKKTDPEQRVQANHNKESHTVFLFPEVSFFWIIYAESLSGYLLGLILFICLCFSGHINSRGNTIPVAPLASGCCSWKHSLVYNNIL